MRILQIIFILVQCLFVTSATENHTMNEERTDIDSVWNLEVSQVPYLYYPEIIEELNETYWFLEAARVGQLALENRLQEDKEFEKHNLVANPSSATAMHQSLLKPSSDAQALSLSAVAIEAATEFLFKNQELDSVIENGERKTRKTGQKKPKKASCKIPGFFNLSLMYTQFGAQFCQRIPYCPYNPYRTFDGSCNNILHPLVGKATTAFLRLLPPAYEDCISLPIRRAVDGSRLPCARKVSQMLGSCTKNKNTAHTMMVMQWGQFIDHDLTLSPTTKVGGYKPVDCCRKRGRHPKTKKRHSECFHICIPKKDPFYSCFDKTCMDFVRTLNTPSVFCTFGPRQQVNDLSHYLDGSMIYSSSLTTANSLREFVGGRLKVQPDGNNFDILPKQSERNCKPHPSYCFKAGDGRVNEQPNLAITHTMWMKEHNRIADYFTANGYNDNDAFNQARKIVIAEIQHITYKEFLPAVLGPLTWIRPSPIGTYYNGYSYRIDPRISNAFATAAFRFGHSLLGDHVETHWGNFHLPIELPLSSLFFNQGPVHYWRNRYLFAIGLSRQHPEKVDMCFTKEVTQRLFEEAAGAGTGLDLVALNIQRGRDHGLPSYVDYRNTFCRSQSPVYSFNDMTWLSSGVRKLLTQVYNDVRDVELFVGGLLEPRQPGALVGETFQCIIGDQFYRLKRGDQYFYENDQQPLPFLIGQLDAIKSQVSLARIFCDNVEGLTEIQPNVFSSSSSYAMCNDVSAIPELNLSLFI